MQKHEEWLFLAHEDLRAAKTLTHSENPVVVAAVYHSQQCAEKALKAYLSYKRQPIKKIHDLIILINSCKECDKEFEILINQALELNPYLTQTRYPDDGFSIPTLELATYAIECAESIFDFVKSKIENIKK